MIRPSILSKTSDKDIVVGSRGSKLAMLQTELVVQRLKRSHTELNFAIRKIKTEGDQAHKADLTQIGGEGVFVKELEEALLAGEIDLAVHSLKDVPTEVGPGLALAAAGMRTDARDALISRSGKGLFQLPSGSRIGTGSQRRAAQVKACRPDLQICPLRGNLDTRLNKLYSGQYEAIIVAAEAMLRMGWQDKITEYLPTELFLPAVAQGAVGVEIKAGDVEIADLAAVINEKSTWLSISAERAFLRALGGGCRAPIAALGTVVDHTLLLEGMVARIDGTKVLRDRGEGSTAHPEEVGILLAEKILGMGGRELIEEIRGEGSG